MIANDSTPDRCYGSVAQSANQFVEAVTATLEACEEIPDEEVAEIEEAGEAFSRDIQALEEKADDGEIQDLRRENQQLRKELSEYRESNELEKASIKKRVNDLEEGGSSDVNPGTDGPKTTIHRPDTPLESVVALPETLVESELSANQERARFLAMDVADYATRVPAGRSLDYSTIKKVLKAKEESTPHGQTVIRVMNFLDRLGKDGTEDVERRGKRRIVFSESAVERLERLSQAGTAGEDGATHGVDSGVRG